MTRFAVAVLVFFFSLPAAADEARATYLANEGVLVQHGETSILFDPLFDNSYNRYELVPGEMKRAMVTGEAPFDSIDAVFVSHYHGDHFAALDMIGFMKRHPAVKLYAPGQAVEAMREIADLAEIDDRVVSIRLEVGETPLTFDEGTLRIGVARIPHSGWPTGMTHVENLAFRVTLDGISTVLHLGDADPRDNHFAANADYWAGESIHLALPPYWYFLAPGGETVLGGRLQPAASVGVHVPTDMPDDPASRPPEFVGYDLFTSPGESRVIPHQHP